MAFQLHSRQKPYNIPFHLIRRINSINGDSGTDGIHVCFWHTDNACAVGTVLYRNSDSTFMKQSLKGHVTFQLFFSRRDICFVCSGKVGEQSLHLYIGKLCDLLNFLNAFCGIRKSNPAHSCVKSNMDMYCFSLTDSLL